MKEYSALTGITLRITFRNSAGTLADPTGVELHVEKPDATKTTYTYAGAAITRVSAGVYTKTITPAAGETGIWKYDWQGTGAVIWYSGLLNGGRKFRVLARQVTPA